MSEEPIDDGELLAEFTREADLKSAGLSKQEPFDAPFWKAVALARSMDAAQRARDRRALKRQWIQAGLPLLVLLALTVIALFYYTR